MCVFSTSLSARCVVVLSIGVSVTDRVYLHIRFSSVSCFSFEYMQMPKNKMLPVSCIHWGVELVAL